jgi:hypothetical protein
MVIHVCMYINIYIYKLLYLLCIYVYVYICCIVYDIKLHGI